MKIKYTPEKKVGKVKRIINTSIGFIGLLLIAGLLISMLVIDRSDAVSSTESPGSAVTTANSQNLNANAAPAPNINPKIGSMTPDQKKALRNAAAERLKAAVEAGTVIQSTLVTDPTGALIPHYFGP